MTLPVTRCRIDGLLVILALTPCLAVAQNGTGVDAQENLFGATNINATTGHGRLTAGISREGDVTVLSWPSPSYNDQLAYISSNALHARTQPRFGAPEGAGITAGLRCVVNGTPEVSWFRSDAWSRSQGYGPTDGPNPETTFVNDAWGLTVVQTDAIAPQSDTFVRSLLVSAGSSAAASDCTALFYTNLSPLPPESRFPELPIGDWATDGRNDFGALWDPDAGVVIHFHPSGERQYDEVTDIITTPTVDYGALATALEQGDPDEAGARALTADLDSFGSGAWAVVKTVPDASAHQVGFDATPLCAAADALIDNIIALPETFPGITLPLEPGALAFLRCQNSLVDRMASAGWTATASDPWTDLQDGTLDGHHAAADETASAQMVPVTFGTPVQLVIGFGATLTAARTAADVDPATVAPAAEAAVAAWLDDRRIPADPGSRPWEVARRALLNLRVGTDVNGAIVASIARQPPYGLDWPRDGAFFNIMLDASGQSALVDTRNALYAGWQRTEAVEPTPLVDPPPPVDPRTGESTHYPADAWEMNYYADGLVGGVFRFEIDSTAFAVWALVAHVGWVDDPAAYLESHWAAIESGAELLTAWRDPETELHAPAQEDDQANHAQTIHGAITVFGALDISARAARLLNRTELAERWEARAEALRGAIEVHFQSDDEGGFFMTESGRIPLLASGLKATGPTAWLVWPMSLYALDHPHIERQLRRDLAIIDPPLKLQNVGGLYYMKTTVSAAVAGHETLPETIAAFPQTLASQATDDTDQFGEVMVVDAKGGIPRADQRVSTPHLWESSLFYLTVLATEDPDALLRYDAVLPESRLRPQYYTDDEPEPGPEVAEPAPTSEEPDNDGCQAGTTGRPALPLVLWFALILFWWARRREAPRPSRRG